MKTSTLIGPPLDWAVSECEYQYIQKHEGHVKPWVLEQHRAGATCPIDWCNLGPIIERELISIAPIWRNAGCKNTTGEWLWQASLVTEDGKSVWGNPCLNPLEAAARCYVASVLGDEVELPEILR